MGGDALSRRRFLEFMMASPLLASGEALAQELQRLPDPSVWGPRTFDKLIASPREALDVFDFELVAHRNVPVAHFGYLASGVDDEVTLRANRDGFQKFQLKPRRLVDVGKVDTRMELFGETYGSRSSSRRPARTRPSMTTASSASRALPGPAIISRCCRPSPRHRSRMRSRHAAARSGSNSTPPTVGSGGSARPPRREGTRRGHCHHGRCAGTAELGDALSPDTARQARLLGLPPALDAELRAAQAQLRRHRPLRAHHHGHTTLTWEFVKRLRDKVKTRLLVKGLMTAEDAKLAVNNGLDGIVVVEPRWPRGGQRPVDHRRPARDRRGGRRTPAGDRRFGLSPRHRHREGARDGARAVAIGRPYLWGLGAFGQPGVERVLAILQGELRSVMMQMGAPSLKDLTPALVRRA